MNITDIINSRIEEYNSSANTKEYDEFIKNQNSVHPDFFKEWMSAFIRKLINMDTNKYFTPDITDLRVGYVCEFASGIGMENQHLWKPLIITQSMFPTILRDYKLIRVPYITKQDIIDRGWVISEKSKGITTVPENYEFCVFLKDDYVLSYVKEKSWMEVMKKNNEDSWYIFQGEIKDVNAFDYIVKLLNIS